MKSSTVILLIVVATAGLYIWTKRKEQIEQATVTPRRVPPLPSPTVKKVVPPTVEKPEKEKKEKSMQQKLDKYAPWTYKKWALHGFGGKHKPK